MSAMKRVLRVRDGLAITVGIVIGAGILRTPGLIAEYLGNGWLTGAGRGVDGVFRPHCLLGALVGWCFTR